MCDNIVWLSFAALGMNGIDPLLTTFVSYCAGEGAGGGGLLVAVEGRGGGGGGGVGGVAAEEGRRVKVAV